MKRKSDEKLQVNVTLSRLLSFLPAKLSTSSVYMNVCSYGLSMWKVKHENKQFEFEIWKGCLIDDKYG